MDRRYNEPEVLLSDIIAICIFDVLDNQLITFLRSKETSFAIGNLDGVRYRTYLLA